MKLKIVTPERVVFEDEVDAVYARSVEGEFGVLPKHIPLVTPLEVGLVQFTQAGSKRFAAVMGGLFETNGDVATILSDTAELSDEIDRVRAEESKARAEARLREKNADVDLNRAKLSLSRALTRLKAIH